ncbi:hypothetical protein KUF59_07040 [Bradyrhizobium arachidis]|nr:hypothetical protein [Bradyrhizobium arachidis]UVO30445.1 hypothetical protein KUF59_07040 [Bradyrhizobium arachidis]
MPIRIAKADIESRWAPSKFLKCFHPACSASTSGRNEANVRTQPIHAHIVSWPENLLPQANMLARRLPSSAPSGSSSRRIGGSVDRRAGERDALLLTAD